MTIIGHAPFYHRKQENDQRVSWQRWIRVRNPQKRKFGQRGAYDVSRYEYELIETIALKYCFSSHLFSGGQQQPMDISHVRPLRYFKTQNQESFETLCNSVCYFCRYTPGLKCDAHLESLRPSRDPKNAPIQVLKKVSSFETQILGGKICRMHFGGNRKR